MGDPEDQTQIGLDCMDSHVAFEQLTSQSRGHNYKYREGVVSCPEYSFLRSAPPRFRWRCHLRSHLASLATILTLGF